MVGPEDEELHPIGRERHWQESYYFNWADPRSDVLGLTRIGFRFNEHQMDGLVLTMRNGLPEFVYPAVNLRHRGGWEGQRAQSGLRTKALVYTMEEPLKKWRLELSGKNAMELEWTAFTPPFDYHDSGRDLPPNVAGEHFEQSGRVEGWTRFKGKTLELRGTGQRDKSWGVREWARVEGWNWISAQFGEDLSFNVWEGWFDGKRYINGFVFRDGENHAVENLSVQFQWGRREHVPAKTLLEITDSSGASCEVGVLPLAQCPLVKSGLWLQEIYGSFTLESKGQKRPGIGIIEHAWHAGTWKTLRRAGELFGAARHFLLP